MISYDKHGYDLAEEILELSIKNQKALFRTMESDIAADFLPYIEAQLKVQVFLRFPISKQKEIVSKMASDDVVDLLRLLPEPLRNKLLKANDDQAIILTILELDEHTIGAHVNIDYCDAEMNASAKEVTKKLIKEAPQLDIVDTIFIHENHVFKGVVELKHLLKTSADVNMIEVLKHYETCYEDDSIDQAIQVLKTTNQKMLPVLNHEQQLLGVITLDDALDLLEEEAIEDFEKMITARMSYESTFITAAFQRLPWLVMVLVLFIPMLFLSHQFESIIEKVVVLMLFQPLILGTAGNVATQILAITLQNLTQDFSKLNKTIKKELITSFMISFSIALIALIFIFIYGSIRGFQTPSPVEFSLVIASSLALTLLLSPIIAMLVPITLKSLKIDPAIASGPFITTLIDITAILIYFSVATLLLGALL
jgi:magnesium transporter